MLTSKRVIIATVCGFVFGLVCMGLASSSPDPNYQLTAAIKLNIVLSRTLLGFTIGISAIRCVWWLHGILIGIIASIPMGLAIMDRPMIAVSSVVMGIIYGVLTELVTTILFKAQPAWRLPTPTPTPAA